MSFGKSLGEFIQSIINSKSDPAAKGRKVFKQKTEESAFVWLESKDFFRPNANSGDGISICKLHEKFKKSLVKSNEETQRKFVLLSMPKMGYDENNELKEVDYAVYGYKNTEDCVKIIMQQYCGLKEEYEQKGLGIKIKELSPFLTDAYLDLYNINSWEEVLKWTGVANS